ncbi:MAG TPA: nuclear transport factor 2 family protein [Pseudonocardia sp.]|jgi:carboxymethylenebutenolidase
MTPGIQAMIRDVERLWDEHTTALFDRRDVPAALARMSRDAVVRHLPSGEGGTGLDGVRAFYAERLVPTLPGSLRRVPVSRTVDQFRLAQESTWRFVHDREMPWLLAGVEATGRPVELLVVEIARVRQGRIAERRLLWDSAELRTRLGG